MYLTFLRRELFGRARQTVIVACGLAIAIALVIVVSALSTGVKQAQAQALEGVYGVGTDLTITGAAAEPGQGGPQRFDFRDDEGSSANGTTNLTRSRLRSDPRRGTLSADTVATIEKTDGVSAATGVLSLTNTTFTGQIPDRSQFGAPGSGTAPGAGGSDSGGAAGGSQFGIESFTVYGVDPAQGGVGPLTATEVTKGRALRSADSGKKVAVVDATYAETQDLAVGDTVTVGDSKVTIVGVVSSTSNDSDTPANVYLPITTARSLGDTGKVVSTVYVSADSASTIDAVQAAITKALPDATVSSQSDLAGQVSGALSSASSLISSLGRWLSVAVLAVALLIAVLLTGSGVARRTREFGTLKAIGWSNGRVVSQVAGESMVQALIGGVAGLVLGLGAIGVINAIGPTLSTGDAAATTAGVDAGGAGAGGAGAGGPGGGFGPGSFGQSAQAAADIVLQAPITWWVVAAAVGLALLGGVLAGAFGGWRAAKLSPVEALRTIG